MKACRGQSDEGQTLNYGMREEAGQEVLAGGHAVVWEITVMWLHDSGAEIPF